MTQSPKLGIGALSKATGIPVETLRTWERRYQFPNPERTPSGHRVYTPDTIEHLKSIAQAIAAGHRASRVVGLPYAELIELIGGTRINAFREQDPVPTPHTDDESNTDAVLTSWYEAVCKLNDITLIQGFHHEWSRMGAMQFILQRATPFLEKIGQAWSHGEISIAHEHFASEHIRDFLTSRWRPMMRHNWGPVILCTTLPDELHQIALHMAANILAMSGMRILFLGMSTPLTEIIQTADQIKAHTVLVSVSTAMDRLTSTHALTQLRMGLPKKTQLVVGGSGAPGGLKGINYPGSLQALESWALQLAQEA